jgi:hypothetical protein
MRKYFRFRADNRCRWEPPFQNLPTYAYADQVARKYSRPLMLIEVLP